MPTTAKDIEAEVKKVEKMLNTVVQAAMADGELSPQETKVIEGLNKKLDELKKKAGVAQAAGGGSTATFDDRAFVREFDASLSTWADKSQSALNSVATYFESDESSGMSLNDVLGIVGWIVSEDPRAKAIIETAQVISTVVQAIYKAGLPKQPSVSQLHDQWVTSMEKYARQSHAKEYAAFVAEYKKKHKLPAGVTEVNRDDFMDACKTVWKQLPTQDRVKKAFLGKLLANVPDTMDYDYYAEEAGASSGVAEVYMTVLAGGGSATFGNVGGQIDDADEKLVNAVKTVWKNACVIELPIPLEFELNNVMGATMAVIHRKEKKSGSTKFKLTSGRKEYFEYFMNEKGWKNAKVSHLKHDS